MYRDSSLSSILKPFQTVSDTSLCTCLISDIIAGVLSTGSMSIPKFSYLFGYTSSSSTSSKLSSSARLLIGSSFNAYSLLSTVHGIDIAIIFLVAFSSSSSEFSPSPACPFVSQCYPAKICRSVVNNYTYFIDSLSSHTDYDKHYREFILATLL